MSRGRDSAQVFVARDICNALCTLPADVLLYLVSEHAHALARPRGGGLALCVPCAALRRVLQTRTVQVACLQGDAPTFYALCMAYRTLYRGSARNMALWCWLGMQAHTEPPLVALPLLCENKLYRARLLHLDGHVLSPLVRYERFCAHHILHSMPRVLSAARVHTEPDAMDSLLLHVAQYAHSQTTYSRLHAHPSVLYIEEMPPSSDAMCTHRGGWYSFVAAWNARDICNSIVPDGGLDLYTQPPCEHHAVGVAPPPRSANQRAFARWINTRMSAYAPAPVRDALRMEMHAEAQGHALLRCADLLQHVPLRSVLAVWVDTQWSATRRALFDNNTVAVLFFAQLVPYDAYTRSASCRPCPRCDTDSDAQHISAITGA